MFSGHSELKNYIQKLVYKYCNKYAIKYFIIIQELYKNRKAQNKGFFYLQTIIK